MSSLTWLAQALEVLGYAARRSQLRRAAAATQAHADLAMRGDTAAGVAHIHQGLAALQGVGPELLRPYWLSLLSEAYCQARQPESGLQILAEALTLVAATEERWWEAELYRLQGELLLRLPYRAFQLLAVR